MKKTYLILWFFIFIGEFLFPYILSFYRAGYSHLDMPLSALGGGKDVVASLYSLWQIISGIGMIIVFINFYNANKEYTNKSFIVGVAFMIAFAVGSCVLSGIFKVDETREMVSISAKIHGGFSVLAFFLLNFIPLLMINFLKKSNFSHPCLVACLFFIVSIICFVLIILSEKETFVNTFVAHSGLWQRLFLVNNYSFFTMMFVRNLENFKWFC